jgi:hypothetical protein
VEAQTTSANWLCRRHMHRRRFHEGWKRLGGRERRCGGWDGAGSVGCETRLSLSNMSSGAVCVRLEMSDRLLCRPRHKINVEDATRHQFYFDAPKKNLEASLKDVTRDALMRKVV